MLLVQYGETAQQWDLESSEYVPQLMIFSSLYFFDLRMAHSGRKCRQPNKTDTDSCFDIPTPFWCIHKTLDNGQRKPSCNLHFWKKGSVQQCPGIEICRVVIPLTEGLCEIRLATTSMIRCNRPCPIFTCTVVFVLHLKK